MLQRFDPFREFDQLIRQNVGENRRWTPSWGSSMAIDAYRRDDKFVVEMDLPGVDPESIDVTVERDVLEVAATRRAHYSGEEDVLIAERPHGEVRRQLFLGEGLDTERIEASYDAGVLTLLLPVADSARPQRIEVRSGESPKAVNAGARS